MFVAYLILVTEAFLDRTSDEKSIPTVHASAVKLRLVRGAIY